MKSNSKPDGKRFYLGIDIGGTKIQASVVAEAGAVLARERLPTPRGEDFSAVIDTVEQAALAALAKGKLGREQVSAVGVAVPGVVDPDSGQVVVTPNMNLTGVNIGAELKARLKVPVAVGNDCNLGALGEKWLGSARDAASVVAILVGTGIGGGFVRNGKLWRGAREAAVEIGHIVMQIDGPECGCGNRGCLEALASRSAIERDIRAAVAEGRPTVLTELCGGDLSVIRSNALRKALEADDALAHEVIERAARVLGHACLTVRHLIDPEVIVLGGGVVEACSEFLMPIVEQIVGDDRLPGARSGGQVLLSALGDDAVVIGAVALARRLVRRNPFKRKYAISPKYPQIVRYGFGEIVIGKKRYDRDVCISVYGKVKKRKKWIARELYGDAHVLGARELEEICRGGPELLVVGAGQNKLLELTDDAKRYLSQRSIKVEVLPTPEAVELYNKAPQRKAAMLHITC